MSNHSIPVLSTPSTPLQDSQNSPDKVSVRAVIAVSVGNSVEFFDWTVYATFSIYFATQIFPKGHGSLALLATLTTYALAFFFRPLGGYLIGRYSDLRGRRPAMMLSVGLMCGGSLAIAVLPTYAQVGWAAPILLLLARIAQGVAMGGELPNASAYLAEIAPADKRGRYSSLVFISIGIALLAASSVGVALTSTLERSQLESWGWRIPFVIGALIGLIVLFLRRGLQESAQFEEAKRTGVRVARPLRTTLKNHPRAVLQIVGLVLTSTLVYYTFFSAITPYAVKYRGADADDVFAALSIGTVIFILCQYPMGRFSDRFGRKPQLLVYTGFFVLATVPMSNLIGGSFVSLLLLFSVSLAMLALCSSILSVTLCEMFPVGIRTTGIGTWYNLTTAVFGGTAPLVISALASRELGDVFFWYISGAAAISFIITLLTPEPQGMNM